MTNEFQVANGAHYKSRDGVVHGPMIHEIVANIYRSPLNGYWAANGRWKTSARSGSDKHPCDLVERVHVLTDAELEAIERQERVVTGFAEDGKTVSLAFETEEGGIVVLARWPEGYVLRYHGEIVWRSWDQPETKSVKLKLSVESNVEEKLEAMREAMQKSLASVLSTPYPKFAEGLQTYHQFMVRAAVIGASRERALIVLSEELRKAMALPNATVKEAIDAAARRLAEEAYQ